MADLIGRRARAAGVAFLVTAAPAVAPAGTVAILHRFGSVPNDGYYPETDLVPDRGGGLIGGTQQGAYGGVIFRIGADGHYAILHAFGDSDGAIVNDRVTLASSGDIIGLTEAGGAYGRGVAYRIAADGTFSVLHDFGSAATAPQTPYGDLVPGPGGAYYGTTGYGGRYGFGTVFRMSPAGEVTVLYSFQGKADGNYPDAGVAIDAAGNVYGVTYSGGVQAGRAGTVWKLTPAGALVVLHGFSGAHDGGYPQSAPILDPAGNLLGCAAQSASRGTIYEITAAGTFRTLHEFTGPDGAFPLSRLMRDAAGNLYGTAAAGGAAKGGTVFRLAPHGTLTVLNSPSRIIADEEPRAGVVMDAAGRLYGTGSGGYIDTGAVFRISP